MCNLKMNAFSPGTIICSCLTWCLDYVYCRPGKISRLVHWGVTQVPTISTAKYFVNLGSPNLTSGLFNTSGRIVEIETVSHEVFI